MDDVPIAALQIPSYKLFYLDSIKDEPLTTAELEQLRQDYDQHEMDRIVDALRWASEHVNFPFSSLLPGIPFSNHEAHTYLVNLLRQIEQAPKPASQ